MSFSYGQLVGHVAERSAVLRSAVAGVLDVPVPGCPEWTGRDLVTHLGEVQRFWAANVAAGPSDTPVDDAAVPDRAPSGDLLDWSEGGTDALVAALRAADPEQGVWTWWTAPRTAAAVARHQVQEVAVHAWDALEAAGRAEALPAAIALDGIDEFFTVEVPGNQEWKHGPATVAVVAAEDPEQAWLVSLTAAGGEVSRGRAAGDAVLRGTASDLVLALYGRRGIGTLDVAGDREVGERFLEWFVTA